MTIGALRPVRCIGMAAGEDCTCAMLVRRRGEALVTSHGSTIKPLAECCLGCLGRKSATLDAIAHKEDGSGQLNVVLLGTGAFGSSSGHTSQRQYLRTGPLLHTKTRMSI